MPVHTPRPLLAAAAAACLLHGLGSAAPAGETAAFHTAAAGAGATASASVARFPVGSPAMARAEAIAAAYWNTAPCSGAYTVGWAVLDSSVNATSTWWNPSAAYGNAPANTRCNITLNQSQDFDWPMFCTVMVHEVGHLNGQRHVSDRTSVMYPVYLAPIPACQGTVAGAAASAQAHRAHRRSARSRHHATTPRGVAPDRAA